MTKYYIDLVEAADAICQSCPHIKLLHSGFYKGEYGQIDPEEWDCPIHCDPDLVYDEENFAFYCKFRGVEE